MPITGKDRLVFPGDARTSTGTSTRRAPKMLYEITHNGETRKVMANFSRNGFFYTLDRANGQFLRGRPVPGQGDLDQGH